VHHGTSVCTLSGTADTPVFLHTLGPADDGFFEDWGPIRIFWIRHDTVPCHVVTAEKPATEQDGRYGAMLALLTETALAHFPRDGWTYDVRETPDILVIAIGPPEVLEAARIETFFPDGLPSFPLNVPARRRAFHQTGEDEPPTQTGRFAR
jgi:hypothetical protein